jgi:hypothetical protein
MGEGVRGIVLNVVLIVPAVAAAVLWLGASW